MRLRQESISKYLHAIAVEELRTQYESNGYVVRTDVEIDAFRVDIHAQKGEKIELIEVRDTQSLKTQRAKWLFLNHYAQARKNTYFKIVWAQPPQYSQMEIDGLEHLLRPEVEAYLQKQSSQISLIHLGGIRIDKMNVQPSGMIYVEGVAVADVCYIEEEQRPDALPVYFKLALALKTNKLRIRQVHYLNIEF